MRGFELYHGYFRVGIITTVQYLSNMHLLNGKLNFIKLAKKGNRPKAIPALMRKYGVDNFKEEKGALYVFDRKVVIDEKEKKTNTGAP